MKDLKKNLFLLIAIFPVIILLSSIFAEKAIGQDIPLPPQCDSFGTDLDCDALGNIYNGCQDSTKPTMCLAKINFFGAYKVNGPLGQSVVCCNVSATAPTPTPAPPTPTPTQTPYQTSCKIAGGYCNSYLDYGKCSKNGYSKDNSDTSCLNVGYCCLPNSTDTPTPTTFSCTNKPVGTLCEIDIDTNNQSVYKYCNSAGECIVSTPASTPTTAPVPPAASAASLKWTVIASCTAPTATPISVPTATPSSTSRVTMLGDYCDSSGYNKCSSGQVCNNSSCDQEGNCTGTCISVQNTAPTATLAPGVPTATPTPTPISTSLPQAGCSNYECTVTVYDDPYCTFAGTQNITTFCGRNPDPIGQCRANGANSLKTTSCVNQGPCSCAIPATPIPTSTPASSVSIPTATPTPTPIPVGMTSAAFKIALLEISDNPKRENRKLKIEIFDPENNNAKIADLTDRNIANDKPAKQFKGIHALDATFKSGIYNIKVKTDGYLRKLILSVRITKGVQNDVALATLTPGDINGDNRIDILDYNLLKDCFGNKANTPTCSNKVNSDLNDDDVVDGIDYNAFIKGLSVKEGD